MNSTNALNDAIKEAKQYRANEAINSIKDEENSEDFNKYYESYDRKRFLR
jgi:hypothetical protein